MKGLEGSQEGMTYPVAIVAPPGAGKTSIIMLALQETALRYQEQDEALRLLCLVPSEKGRASNLKAVLASEWAVWAKEHLTAAAQIELVIADIDEFSASHFVAKAPPLKAAPLQHCEDFIVRKLKCRAEEAANIYKQFCLASILLNKDVEKKHDFEASYYLQTGEKQTLVTADKKEKVYQLYQDYMAVLTTEGFYHSELSPMVAIDEEQRFHRVMVDEMQQYSTQQLANALSFAIEGRCVYAGDGRQNTQYLTVSPQAVLGPFLHHLTKGAVTLSFKTLDKTHRLPPDVARFGAALFCLQDNVCGGAPDKLGYSSLTTTSLLPDTQTVFLVEESCSEFKALGDNARAASIALLDDEVEPAAHLINTANGFSSTNAHSLEFDTVFIFISEECQRKLHAFSNAMAAEGITADILLQPKVNRSAQAIPKELEESIALLNKLYVALSRSTNQVYIYWEPIKKQPARHFHQWLAAQCSRSVEEKKVAVVPKIKVVASSKEEWIVNINYLIRHRFHKQALDNLIKQFGLQEEDANHYIRTVQQHPGQTIGLELIEQLKQEPPTPALAKALANNQPTPAAAKKPLSVDKPATSKKDAIPAAVRGFKLDDNAFVNNIITILEGESPDKWLGQYELPEDQKTIFEVVLQNKKSFVRLFLVLQQKEDFLIRFVKAIKPHFHRPLHDNPNCSYLQLLIMRFITLKWNDRLQEYFLKNILSELTAKTINTPCPELEESGASILYLLLKGLHPGLVEALFKNYPQLISKEGLSHPILTGNDRGKTALYLLIKDYTPVFVTFVGKPAHLKLITQKALHCLLTEDIPEQGMTPFFILCGPKGLQLLHKQWAFFQKMITSEQLHQAVTREGASQGMTPFFLLCTSFEGRELLKEQWVFFQNNISQQQLHQVATGKGALQGSTPFYLLCAEPDGRQLLLEQWPFFQDKITQEQLHQIVTGKGAYQGTTPFYLLCAEPDGRQLLLEQWLFFKEKITQEQLHQVATGEGSFQGATPFYLLCKMPEGQQLLREQWSFFQDKITIEQRKELETSLFLTENVAISRYSSAQGSTFFSNTPAVGAAAAAPAPQVGKKSMT